MFFVFRSNLSSQHRGPFSPSSTSTMKNLLLLAIAGLAAAEDGLNAWLRYSPIANAQAFRGRLPTGLVALNSTQESPVSTAAKELAQGLNGLFGVRLASASG